MGPPVGAHLPGKKTFHFQVNCHSLWSSPNLYVVDVYLFGGGVNKFSVNFFACVREVMGLPSVHTYQVRPRLISTQNAILSGILQVMTLLMLPASTLEFFKFVFVCTLCKNLRRARQYRRKLMLLFARFGTEFLTPCTIPRRKKIQFFLVIAMQYGWIKEPLNFKARKKIELWECTIFFCHLWTCQKHWLPHSVCTLWGIVLVQLVQPAISMLICLRSCLKHVWG